MAINPWEPVNKGSKFNVMCRMGSNGAHRDHHESLMADHKNKGGIFPSSILLFP